MKKHICLMILILMLGAAACGEVATGTVSGDWGDAFLGDWGAPAEETAAPEETAKPAQLDKDVYYHEADDCSGKTGRKQVKKSKLPCPICVDDDLSSRVTAKVRGGTVIVRIPVKWMEKQDDFEKSTFSIGDREYGREEGLEKLAGLIHGEDYCDFLEDWEEDGKAKAYTWDADIYDSASLLVMNRRFIGNAWYVVLRPLEKIEDDELRVSMGMTKGKVEAKGDTLSVTQTHDWLDDKFKLKLSKDSADADFKQEFDGFRLTLYETMDMYVAVVYKYDATEDELFYLRLTPGDREPIVMNGYMSGDKGVYCGMLTKGEAQIIMDGGEVTVENAPMF